MPVEHIALLKIERDLHDIPRGMERFGAYLKTLINDEGDDVKFPPLVAMNPMGREHVAERLDELLALDADEIAAQTVREAVERVGGIEGDFKHGLVVMDDVRGGWTNRITNDAAFRFGFKLPLKRMWISTALWVSKAQTAESIRQAVLSSIYRYHYIQQHGVAVTLDQMIRQEGAVLSFAGVPPTFDAEELDYSTQVIAPIRQTKAYPVYIAALYGDNAARSLGYEPMGLSDNAGFEVGLAESWALSR